MSEKQGIIKNQLYNKFVMELKENDKIYKETFNHSNFHLMRNYELQERKNDTRCTCGVKLLNVYVLRSNILNKQ
jgi:hypothetical protein